MLAWAWGKVCMLPSVTGLLYAPRHITALTAWQNPGSTKVSGKIPIDFSGLLFHAYITPTPLTLLLLLVLRWLTPGHDLHL